MIFELKFASNEIFGLSLTFKSPSLILKNDETPLKSLINKSVLSAKKEKFAFSKFKFFTISVLKLVTFPFVIKLSIEFFSLKKNSTSAYITPAFTLLLIKLLKFEGLKPKDNFFKLSILI